MYKKFISILMVSLLCIFSVNWCRVSADSIGVTNFVSRLYEVCLNRAPDSSGLVYWTGQLENKTGTGVSVAYGFVYSEEFQNKQTTNEEYITYLYNAFFDRQPDVTGFNYWLGRLNNGMSRESLFSGFANSLEFYNLCNEYRVVQGTFHNCGNQIRNAYIDLFVDRLYRIVLERNGDLNGLGAWSNELYYRNKNASEIVYGFFWSDEYLNRNKSDGDFIEDLYMAMFGRNSDSAGKADWINRIGNGWTRKQVFNGFIQSAEFANLCSTYQINAGGIIVVDDYERSYINSDVDLDSMAKEKGLIKYVMDTATGQVTVYAEFINMDSLSEMVNDYRRTLGLNPYKVISNNSYARLRAVETAYYFSHNTPMLGSHFSDVPNIGQGENCCTGIDSVSAYNTYFRSLGHRLEWEAFRERTSDLPANYRRHIAICSVGVRLYRINDEGTDFVQMTRQDCMSREDGSYGRGFASVQELWEVENLWKATSWEEAADAYRNSGISFRIPSNATINPGLSTFN